MTEVEPGVSVVIPTWNRRALVLEAVESVRAQTHDDLELLVVDDGSTDGTGPALEAHFADDVRARLVVQANGGTAVARNRGLDAARAPWVAFLDSDDLWAPGYLASQLAVLARHPEADFVLGDVQYENQGRAATTLFADPDFLAPTSLAAVFDGGWGLPSAMVVRTAVARSVRFDPAWPVIEDTEFLLRLNAAGHRGVLNPDRLVRWRCPAGGGAPAKTGGGRNLDLETLRLLETYLHLAPDPAATTQAIYSKHRLLAKDLVAAGRLREARPHLRAWLGARPWRVRPRLWYLLSLLAALRSPGDGEPRSTT